MEFKEIGFKMYGFELGEEVIYNNKKTVVIGFDGDESFLNIIIKRVRDNNGTLLKNSAHKNRITNVLFMDYPMYWVSSSQIKKVKSLQFNKSDLKSGDKIVYRKGVERWVLMETNTIHDNDGNVEFNLDNWTGGLFDVDCDEEYDIIKVYRNDVLIWERIEEPQKTAEQLEIERIEIKLREMSVEQNKLADELNRLKSK